MKNFWFLSLAAIFFLLVSCTPAVDEDPMARSDLSRQADMQVSTNDQQALLNGNNAFAFDLYQQEKNGDSNLVFSPYSISLAAAMLYSGAQAETATKMASVLHFDLPSERLHQAFNALSQDLAKRPAQSTKIDSHNPMELNIANSVWGQIDSSFEQDYLDLLAVNYGAGIHLLDFKQGSEPARRQINSWVDRETGGKITELMPAGSVEPDTRLVLANAIYFQAAWEKPFIKSQTREAPFTLLDGNSIQVATMTTNDSVSLRKSVGDGYLALELPYKGDLAEMIVIMPEAGKFTSVEAMLTPSWIQTLYQGMLSSSFTLYMPRFEFDQEMDLKQTLSAMGMVLPFDEEKADFSGITTAEKLYVYQAIHKAYILADEHGTTAAAASGFGMKPASLPMEIHIDRPFIFLIRDTASGTILFIGRVMDPSQK